MIADVFAEFVAQPAAMVAQIPAGVGAEPEAETGLRASAEGALRGCEWGVHVCIS
jgi:hypothetical protein